MNQKYSPEMREKALRMLDEAVPSHPNLMTAPCGMWPGCSA